MEQKIKMTVLENVLGIILTVFGYVMIVGIISQFVMLTVTTVKANISHFNGYDHITLVLPQLLGVLIVSLLMFYVFYNMARYHYRLKKSLLYGQLVKKNLNGINIMILIVLLLILFGYSMGIISANSNISYIFLLILFLVFGSLIYYIVSTRKYIKLIRLDKNVSSNTKTVNDKEIHIKDKFLDED